MSEDQVTDITVKTETKPEVVKEKPQKNIALTEQGLLAPADSSEEMRVCKLMLESGALPEQFKNVPQVIMARQFLLSHQLPWLVAIRQTAIINGTLSIWGELPKALCDRSGQLEYFKEFLFDKEYNEICFANKNLDAEIFGAYCEVKRKGQPEKHSRTFLVSDAKTAGLWGKSIWQKYPKRMIQMRCRSHCLKDVFPDVLSGIAINEYDFHGIDPSDIEQPGKFARELNRQFQEETGTEQGSSEGH